MPGIISILKHVLLVVIMVLPVQAANFNTVVDDLLRSNQMEKQIDQSRFNDLLSDHQQLDAELREMKAALKELEDTRIQLELDFESNEQALAEGARELEQANENLGPIKLSLLEQFAQTETLLKNSIQSWEEERNQLKAWQERAVMPSRAQLNQYWTLLLEGIASSGSIDLSEQNVVQTDGQIVRQPVWRLGEFAWLNQQGKYLVYDGQLRMTEVQPAAVQGQTSLAYLAGQGMQAFLDPTRGAAMDMLSRTPDLRDRLKQAGGVGVVIGVLLFLGGMIALIRLFMLLRARSELKGDQGIQAELDQVAEDCKDMDLESLQLKLEERALRFQPKLERGLPMIKLMAAIAPMLGLLGTVSGMIQTFQAITLTGSNDPSLLAGGISMALMTTVLGLVAAIPLLLLHTGLQGLSQSITNQLELAIASRLTPRLERQDDA